MNHEELNKFGEIVHEARTRLDLSLELVSSRCGFHKGYLSGIENGKVNPPSPRLTKKLARVLQLNEDWLITLGHAQKAPAKYREFFVELVQERFVVVA